MGTARINDVQDDLIVEVFNDHHSSVGYKLDRITRSFDIGTAKKIKMDELYELVNTKGGKFLLEENMLLIKDSSVREALGIKPLTKYSPSTKEIQEMLVNGKIQVLEELLQYCSDTTLEKIVRKAIDLPLENMAKARLIKSYSGIDVISIMQEQAEDKPEESATRAPISEGEEEGPVRRRRVVKE